MIRPRMRVAAAAAFVGAAVAPLRAQEGFPERRELPRWSEAHFQAPYPSRLLTLETARVLDGGAGIVGFGDTRYGVVDGRVELVTNTISDLVGIANLGVKIGVRDAAGGGPGVAAGVKYYQSYPGLINKGVRRIAGSFSTITDADVDVSGWVAWGTATWTPTDGATAYHLGVQGHLPAETRFEVADSVRGGGGSLTFEEGQDASVLWGVDHQLVGTKLILVGEAGWSFGLERARFGVGVDAGSEHWRVLLGLTYPGTETDVATEPRDFVVNPAFSLHYRW